MNSTHSSAYIQGYADGTFRPNQAVQRVLATGVMSVSPDGAFRPNDVVTRAKAVTLLNRLVKIQPDLSGTSRWKDVSEGHWAYGAIQAASQN